MTGRLVLRQFERSDFDAHFAIMQDPDVIRFLGPAMSREDVWRRTLGWVGSWPVVGFGGWMVERRSDGRIIGNVGLFNAWRAMEPEFGDDPEMGWIFAREVHGQGLAGEACAAILDWADTALPPTPIWAIISPGNVASLTLADRLGFTRLEDSVYQGHPTAVLRRPPRDSTI